jgi:hypothetical protein
MSKRLTAKTVALPVRAERRDGERGLWSRLSLAPAIIGRIIGVRGGHESCRRSET